MEITLEVVRDLGDTSEPKYAFLNPQNKPFPRQRIVEFSQAAIQVLRGKCPEKIVKKLHPHPVALVDAYRAIVPGLHKFLILEHAAGKFNLRHVPSLDDMLQNHSVEELKKQYEYHQSIADSLKAILSQMH